MSLHLSNPRAAAARCLAVLGVGAVLLGCGGPDPATSQESCARTVTFDGRTYGDVLAPDDVVNRRLDVQDRLGVGTSAPCDDSGGDTGGKAAPAAPGDLNVYAVAGLDSAVGVAVGASADSVELFVVRSGTAVPAEAEEFIAAVRASRD